MGKQLEIFIDGTRLNYEDADDFPLSLNLSIEAAEDPSKVSGAHSKRAVSFPGDKEVEAFFEEWVNTGRINPDASKRKPARIEANGLPVFTGTAQLEEASGAGAHYRRRGSQYRTSFFGNNATWFELLRDKRVRDCGLMPDHELTNSVVALHDNPDPDTDDWGYFLARTKDWIAPGTVRPMELTPFIFIGSIVREAFREIGYTIQSDFFNTDFFKRQILPVPVRPLPEDLLRRWTIYRIQETNLTLGAGIGTFVHVTVEPADVFNFNPLGLYDTTTGYYTAPISGYYVVVVMEQTISVSHRVRKNNGTPEPLFTDPGEIGIGIQGRILLHAGDVLDLVISASAGFPAGTVMLYIRPDINAYDAGTSIRFDLYGNPDWRLTDMLLGITQAYGLVWSTDPDAFSIRVEPRDRYLLTDREAETTTAHEGFYRIADRVDMTPKLDLAKDATVKNIHAAKENYIMAWKSDSADANIEDLEEGSTLLTYDGHYSLPADRFYGGEDRRENKFFSKTLHLLDSSIQHASSDIIPQIPVMQSEVLGTEQDTIGDFLPRILYFAGRRDGLDGYVNGLEDVAYDFPAAWMVNFNDPTGLDPSLAFSNETVGGSSVVPGLLQRFHLQFLKRLEVGKMASEWICWKATDILGLDFRTKILLGENLYLLQAIEGYKPLADDTTETVLMLDAIPEADDPDNITGSTIRGLLPKTA